MIGAPRPDSSAAVTIRILATGFDKRLMTEVAGARVTMVGVGPTPDMAPAPSVMGHVTPNGRRTSRLMGPPAQIQSLRCVLRTGIQRLENGEK